MSVVIRGPQNERADNDRCLRFRRADNRLCPAASGGTADNGPRRAFRPGASTDYSPCLHLRVVGSAVACDWRPRGGVHLTTTADYSPPVPKVGLRSGRSIGTHPFIASKVTLRRTKGVAPTHPVGARPFAHQLCSPSLPWPELVERRRSADRELERRGCAPNWCTAIRAPTLPPDERGGS